MPRIPDETLERIAAANDIVEVIGVHVPLKRAGSTYRGLCPFHKEKTPSFHVNPARQNYHCFGCGAHGSVFRFLMEYENLDFIGAVRRLAERAGIPLTDIDFSAEEDSSAAMRRRLLALHQEAADWFHKLLLRSKAAAHAREYLKSRGINKEIAVSWKLGYAPEAWEAFSSFARDRKFSDAEIRASGLVKLRDEENPKSDFYDRFRDRLMFPICNEQGNVIAFSGRVLNPDAPGGKYVNSPETPLFVKGNVLFGLHKSNRALIETGTAIVCEGQLDLITAYEAGIKNVIAPQGTAFTERQARILQRLVQEVILCFDADAAGQQAAERSLPALMDNNLIVRVAVMPEGEDPDSMIRKHGPEAFAAQIQKARDFFEFQIDRLSQKFDRTSLRGQMQFARRMAESIALIKDPFMREAVVNRVATSLGMAPEDVRGLLKNQRRTAPKLPEEAEPAVSVEEADTAPPPMSILLLCQVALSNPEARAWLLQQPWQPLLERVSHSHLLSKILSAEIRPDDSRSVSTFLDSLSRSENAALGQVVDRTTTEQPLTLVQDWWRALQRQDIRSQITALQAQQRRTDLPWNEVLETQVKVTNLKQELDRLERETQPPSAR